MIRQNKWKLILASVLILLPALFGAIFWKYLPEEAVLHWDVLGSPDGWGSRLVGVLLLPLLLLGLFWFSVWITARDHCHRKQDGKVFGMVIWTLPILSLWVNGMIYAASFGLSFNLMIPVCLLLGILFLLMGNYMPKCRPNHTIGIRLKWTLGNEENWNATHRLAGKIWCICGIALLIAAFLPVKVFPWVMIDVIAAAILPVAIYSYFYAQSQIREGKAKAEDFKPPVGKKVTVFSAIMTAVIVVGVGFLMFTGDVEIRYDQTSFGIHADYTGTRQIAYDAILEIEYRENFDKGQRAAGFGSPRLSTGRFQNGELGSYTIYAYTACDSAVVLTIEGNQTVVINGRDEDSTRAIYETLLEKSKGNS